MFKKILTLMVIGILFAACSPEATPTESPEEPAPIETVVVTEVASEEAVTVTEEVEVVITKEVEVVVTPEPIPQFQNWLSVEVLRGSVILDSPSLGTLEHFAGETIQIETDLQFDLERVETDEKGFARITYFDDPDIGTELKPGTIIFFDSLQPGGISFFQELGSTFNVTDSAFILDYRIMTPSATVIQTGTRSNVDVDPLGNTDVAVQEGEVLVETPDGSTVTVQQGQRMEAHTDGTNGEPQNTIFVALDTSHLDDEEDDPDTSTIESTSIGNYTKVIDTIEFEKYKVEWVADLKYSTLINKHVLVLIGSEKQFDEGEIEDIQEWVDEGHGLFVVGEHSNFVPFPEESVNKLLEPYDIQFIDYSDKEVRSARIISEHPVTEGISKLPLNWTNALDGGTWLAETADGLIILSANQKNGRVLVLADANSIDDFSWEGENGRDLPFFILNAVEWLARWR